MADREITPYGCRHCGIPEREHAQRWKQPVGWHRWEPPTDRQILARMRMRQALRLQILDAAGIPFVVGEQYRDRCGDRWEAVLDGSDFLLVGRADGWSREWERLQCQPGDPLPVDEVEDARDLIRSSGPMTLISTLEDQ